MREVALKVMRSLESFHPRLVGPVLEGTADEHARISLHVFNDPPDAVVIHLLDKGWFSAMNNGKFVGMMEVIARYHYW